MAGGLLVLAPYPGPLSPPLPMRNPRPLVAIGALATLALPLHAQVPATSPAPLGAGPTVLASPTAFDPRPVGGVTGRRLKLAVGG